MSGSSETRVVTERKRYQRPILFLFKCAVSEVSFPSSPTSIGRRILTKAPWIFDPLGDEDCDDIIDQYKAAEGKSCWLVQYGACRVGNTSTTLYGGTAYPACRRRFAAESTKGTNAELNGRSVARDQHGAHLSAERRAGQRPG